MNIWIDLVNSPHVLFFMPIIKRLEAQNHHVFITYREFAQTASLVKKYQLSAELIGDHKGKNKVAKFVNLAQRTYQLIKYAKPKKIDLAISHNSYFQIIAAKYLNIPSLTSMDFEGQPANHLAFRFASLVSVPDAFPERALTKFGAKKFVKYRGLKEDICLADFSFDNSYINIIKNAFKLDESDLNKPVVVLRPPPTLAFYHNGDESLFKAILHQLAKKTVTVLVLPRVEEQQKLIAHEFPQFYFPDQILDGLQLVAHADAVLSGGGSMNREAACLGTAAFSFFSGKLPAVDQMLVNQGKLGIIKSAKMLQELTLVKKTTPYEQKSNNQQETINDFMGHIDSLLVKV